MLAFARQWGLQSRFDFCRLAPSLGLFAGKPASSLADGECHYVLLPAPRTPGARPHVFARSPAGQPVLLVGWIDNLDELADALGQPGARPETVYGAAVAQWGEDADRRIVGHYAAVMVLPDGTVRLSRSPWGGPPLFYVNQDGACIVASVPRPIFAAGFPQKLRPGLVEEVLSMESGEADGTHFEGIRQLPHGSVALVTPGGVRVRTWYDPAAIEPVHFAHDEDYVEAANAMLAEAVAKVMRHTAAPAIALSGGLDSAIVCDEILRQLPPGRTLKSFTFHPCEEWDGVDRPGGFGDERPLVQAFAAQHPGLETHFTANDGIAFDHRSADFFLACGSVCAAMASKSVWHGPSAAAHEAGCDLLITAGFGNYSITQHAPWAWPELLRRGQWRELYRAATAISADPRPVWRKIAARAAMPLLPYGLQRKLRYMVHGRKDLENRTIPFLRPGLHAPVPPSRHCAMMGENVADRASFLREMYAGHNLGGEYEHGFEQVFGIRSRDVTGYRPLIEFFAGVPTTQFLSRGRDRWLGRRMAIGRMPEEQRLNRRHGSFNVDWHARMTPRLPEWRAAIERIRDNPNLAARIDTDRALAALDAWPDVSPTDAALRDELAFSLPATLLTASYVDFITGRN